jgi:ribokinase
VSGRVVVVGSVNIDLVVRTDRLPTAGQTVTGGTFERHHGGKGGNQAVAAARLGRPTLFIGAVGDDTFGDEARAALAAEHVDVSGLLTVPEAATGVALILVDARGENLISVASGANATLEPAHVESVLERLGPLAGDVVLVCHEIPTRTVAAALRLGRAAGARTILNPAPAGGLDRATAGLADVLTPNRSELATLAAGEAARTGRRLPAGDDPIRGARTLLERSAEGRGAGEAVVVTLGENGAVLVRRGAGRAIGAVDVPALRVDAVDTTGAGDAFNGALAAALAEGRPLEEAVERAVAGGALACTRLGAREGMPTAAELERSLGG